MQGTFGAKYSARKDRKWVKPEVKEVFTDGKLKNNWESEESRKEGKVDVEGGSKRNDDARNHQRGKNQQGFR